MKRIVDLPNGILYIEPTYEGMSNQAANILCTKVRAYPEGAYGFATGSTPIGLYKELVKRFKAGEIDFSKITTFNLDEYYPIEKSNPQSYNYFMRENLFNHINVQSENIFLPNGEINDPALECAEFERKLREAKICLQILGLGLNGHIGFNEPDEVFSKETSLVNLTESTIEANARFFDSIDEVPREAISMGIGSIMSARNILLLVNGSAKAETLYEALYGKINPWMPASALQFHQNLTVVTDAAAAEVIIKKLNL